MYTCACVRAYETDRVLSCVIKRQRGRLDSICLAFVRLALMYPYWMTGRKTSSYLLTYLLLVQGKVLSGRETEISISSVSDIAAL